MKRKLLAVLIAGAFAVPAAGYAAEKEADKDTPKSFVQESAMTAKIKAAMARDKDVSALRIKVESDSNGVVHLSGKAKSQTEADKAVTLARSVEGVTSVKSDIEVVADAKTADKPAKTADKPDRSVGKAVERESDRAKTAVKDSMVTAKVKAAMARDKEVSALKINVDTDNKGHVHLSGKAKSQAEAEKAVSIARNTEGVTAVTSSIQVSN